MTQNYILISKNSQVRVKYNFRISVRPSCIKSSQKRVLFKKTHQQTVAFSNTLNFRMYACIFTKQIREARGT
uniref:PARP catalytic domain-containing protein n=1 Tax=Meloidogyne incognita TaxID=6306 RepID=A0A914KYW5_MELIC